jgi:hypothetical protein
VVPLVVPLVVPGVVPGVVPVAVVPAPPPLDVAGASSVGAAPVSSAFGDAAGEEGVGTVGEDDGAGVVAVVVVVCGTGGSATTLLAGAALDRAEVWLSAAPSRGAQMA